VVKPIVYGNTRRSSARSAKKTTANDMQLTKQEIMQTHPPTFDRAVAEAASGPGKKTVVNKKKCVYIAPLKALVRERMEDWKVRLEKRMGKKVVELTGDTAPDMNMRSVSLTRRHLAQLAD